MRKTKIMIIAIVIVAFVNGAIFVGFLAEGIYYVVPFYFIYLIITIVMINNELDRSCK